LATVHEAGEAADVTTNEHVRTQAVSSLTSPFASDEETHAQYRRRTRHPKRHVEVIPDVLGAMREIARNARGRL
jgi:hypothetical protein